jgi:periplasmic protein TonB
MALAVGLSMLIHALVAFRLLYAPFMVPSANREPDAPITMLFDTPAPPPAAPAAPETPAPAEPPPPATVTAEPPPPEAASVPPPEAAPVPPPAEPPPPAVAITEPPPREVVPVPPPVAAPQPPAALPAPVQAKPVETAPKPPVRRPAPPRPAPRSRQAAPVPMASSPPPSAPTAAVDPPTLIPARPIRGSAANRDPAYPDAARRRGEQGRVMLRVDVSAGGAPISVTPLQSSGFPRLDDAAVAAVRQWRFEPAERNGKPVEGVADVPILFRLEN